ncbi:MAG: PilT domain-containing protein [Parcubacteria group bacterium Gr01-1014_38]|nr:MAG: PilT domain-containing protein [Parcubacteria group bacterium Gr01-1014_38]
MRVVLDTNVLLSAFLWQKGLRAIYDAIWQRRIVPCFTPATWHELERALRYPKFERQLARIHLEPDDILTLIASRALFTFPRTAVRVVRGDPSDNDFLTCALSAGARAIVSGDRHLRNLDRFRGIPILSPRQFLKQIEG